MRSGRDRLRLCPNCLGNMGCVPGAIWARTHILGHPTGTGDTARTARTTLSKPLIWKSGLGIYSPKEPTEPGKVSTKKHQKKQLYQVSGVHFQWSSVHPVPALLPSSLRAAEGKGGHVGNGGRGLRVGLLNMKWHRYPLSLGSRVALFLCKFSPRQGRPFLVFEVNSRILWFFANTLDSKTKEPRFGSGWWNLRNGLAISEEDDLFFFFW